MRALHAMACAATALCLAVASVAAGLAACAAPPTTRLLAQATEAASGPYEPEQLAELACATRAYTVEARHEGSLEELARAELAAAEAASAPGAPTASRWTATARGALARAGEGASAAQAAAELARAGDQYALDGDALAHLDDCNRLISIAAPWLIVCALGAAAGIAGLAATGQRRALGWVLATGPALVLAAFAGLGLWGALDFDGLFGAFHGVLFPQDNWTFPARSLLIAMYPLDFWMGMAALWLSTTVLLAIISLTLGIFLVRKKKES